MPKYIRQIVRSYHIHTRADYGAQCSLYTQQPMGFERRTSVVCLIAFCYNYIYAI